MPNPTAPSTHTREITRRALSGWPMLALNILLVLGGLAILIAGIRFAAVYDRFSWLILLGPLVEIAGILSLFGHFTLQPNEARVLILFGDYHGTARESGFFWANPFYSRIRAKIPMGADSTPHKHPATGLNVSSYRTLGAKISLRARNFNSDKLKVNDKRGNPIEIAAVVVWRVADTARAAFDVDDFESRADPERTAIRRIASLYSCDRHEEDAHSLRDGADEVAALQRELRSAKKPTVDEARLTHLAYAPEIAQAMLRVQQAEAVIAARKKIVHGAVSMVDMALRELSEKSIVTLDEERKAAMVSNLLVVLCGESEAHPVINTGTLYT